MFKVIVVDDESMIRTGISSFINDMDIGFEVVQTFKDGSEAIEYLEAHDVDVVISDIKMVNVSGIELAHYIYKNKPRIKDVYKRQRYMCGTACRYLLYRVYLPQLLYPYSA